MRIDPEDLQALKDFFPSFELVTGGGEPVQGFVPFLKVTGADSDDVYGINRRGRIAAFSDGTMVANWPSFAKFMEWVREMNEPVPPEDLYLVD